MKNLARFGILLGFALILIAFAMVVMHWPNTRLFILSGTSLILIGTFVDFFQNKIKDAISICKLLISLSWCTLLIQKFFHTPLSFVSFLLFCFFSSAWLFFSINNSKNRRISQEIRFLIALTLSILFGVLIYKIQRLGALIFIQGSFFFFLYLFALQKPRR